MMTRFGPYKSFACGGSLINDRYIMTSAKCVKLFPPEMLSITIGARTGNETSSLPSHDVSTVIVHEKYARFFRRRRKHVFNNIALLKLKNPILLKEENPGDKTFSPVCLPLSHQDDKLGHLTGKLFVSGWAYPALGGQFPSPPTLIDSPVKEFDSKSCQKFYSKILRFDSKKTVCAGGVRGVCFKDEGSPLLSREGGHVFQRGLVSVSRGFADCNFQPKVPTIFERVSVHMPWIKSKTRDAQWCYVPQRIQYKTIIHSDFNQIKETDIENDEHLDNNDDKDFQEDTSEIKSVNVNQTNTD